MAGRFTSKGISKCQQVNTSITQKVRLTGNGLEGQIQRSVAQMLKQAQRSTPSVVAPGRK